VRPLARICVAASLLVPLLAHAWWNEDWAYRKKITLNTSASGADTKAVLADVPVLIRLHTGNFSFLDAKEDGGDLRFVSADDKTPLKYQIEQWDPANELALVWVKVPKLAPGSAADEIWMYSGNPKAAREDDAKGTWDPTTALVLHFAPTQGGVTDSSSHANQVAASGLTGLAQGPIDGAVSLNGSSQIRVPANASLRIAPQTGATYSAWVRIAGPQGQGQLFTQQDGVNALTLGITGNKPYARIGAAQVHSSADLTANAWHHIAATLGAGKLTLYLDGKSVGEAAVQVPDMGGDLTIGTGFQGDLDEVEVSGAVRSADWIRAAWAGQGAEPKLLSYGQDEQAGGAGHSYFKILLSAVTVDGWVVIAILMVMMVISVFVMIGKGIFVSRTDKANRLFMERFQKDPDAMLDPAHASRAPATLQGSSLFRLYSVGLRELGHRFELYERQGQSRDLSPQALGAIKASLDAGMVREQARLNNQMVLLTIAISGGPFLGLLGTVVGVMITFAAIAAAGDVNVNSIAPGIAAALVATVAGLGVAIPALFGYNYLASRIKNMSNDMAVFADELVSRMAERYAP
jgi:biopolymer transport protein ExbB